MSQPIWKLIANLGDVNPIDHGGYFVYEDTTGVYPPEAEVLRNHDDDGEDGPWTVFRFPLDRCTFVDGVLSDNEYHPEFPAWFASPESRMDERPQDTTYLSRVANYSGLTIEELRDGLCSADPIARAYAYQAIGEYHGFLNLDEYPNSDFDRSDLEKRYGMVEPSKYEVIVGNVGSVYCGTDETEAIRLFKDYQATSMADLGMAAGEDVTMFKDGEIEEEYVGSLSRSEPCED